LKAFGPKSLVFVDEIGRGTSPRDATRLSGAILEEMAHSLRASGMFATHLHGIIDLPLIGDRIMKKRLSIRGSSVKDFSHVLEDGVCTDSLAIRTAQHFGMPNAVLARAESFSEFLPLTERLISLATPLPGEASALPGGEGEGEGTALPNHSADDAECEIVRIIQSLTGQKALSIPPKWTAPPSMECGSCLYVLDFDNRKCYVGETDNLEQRLRSHRSKGGQWSTFRAFAVPVNNKSKARSLESRLIRQFARDGFHLESIWDGRHSKHA